LRLLNHGEFLSRALFFGAFCKKKNMNKMGATACESCEEDSEKVYRLKKLWEVSDG
jgi:hypothetical protein